MSRQPNDETPYLSREVCARIIARVAAFADGGGRTFILIGSWWQGELRWARNRVNLSGDRFNRTLEVTRERNGGRGVATTNQLDDVSLEATVRIAERRASESEMLHPILRNTLSDPMLETPVPTIWSSATSKVTAEARGAVAQGLVERAEAETMLSAGYLEMRTASRAMALRTAEEIGQGEDSAQADIKYDRWTQAQCSMTVRHPQGTSSGWAGGSSYDWSQLDGVMIAQRALEKCLASVNPVRIEPGRYTTILEPQAVSQLVEPLMGFVTLSRVMAEGNADVPFWLADDLSLGIGRSKIGLRVIDERISISHDPMDASLGVLPAAGLQPYTFIQDGVLVSLVQDHKSARWKLHEVSADLWRPSFRMTGGEFSLETMIETTKRGLIVTRFSNIKPLDSKTLLCTGLTRDGLWLVEDGKITKAVRNFRFTESPLFVLNQVEQIGPSVPIFRPVVNPGYQSLMPAIVPSLKVRDFSFTSTIDAI